ncbi:MAG: RagB/SusD family nutrient uptake outer membrane protein [Tannerellaceae bacterium]|nr:RagB/SusD family nutrient uptake outer membrane protein [Tannerellaceae bacterium]
MKTKKIIITSYILSILWLGFTACSDFLDKNPSTSVADTEVFKTVSGAQAALNGSYYHMRAYNSGRANREDDYGIPSIQIISDMAGEDIIAWGGWYNYVYNYWGETRADIFRSSQLWNFHYRLINNVNSIITYVDDCEGDELDKQYIKGQALAIRGWVYFDLARLFQQTYSIAKDMPGMPIYTEPTTETTVGKPRGTLEDTYVQILQDLTDAEKLLEGFDRGSRINNFDQTVVQGVLAQVYQVMNNWEKCEEYAMKLLDIYPLTTSEQFLAGFNDETTPSWIWGMRQTEEQNMGDYSIFAFWANDTRKCFTFRTYFLPDAFVNLFDDEDIRASQFEYWWDVIFASYKFRDNEECRGSIVFMRADEMLLNAAEAMARQDRDTPAKELLWQLQDMRNAKRSTSTGDALIEEILLERRKELYGEGHALFDIVRNQKPLLREGNHDAYGGAITLPARSWKFIFQLPISEILNNSSMKDGIWPNGDQNPYDGVYEP